MVETVVALLLFLNGNMVEHVYKDNLAQCNESKKIAESVVNTRNVTFVCKEVKAKTIIDEPVMGIDWMPTFSHITGSKL